MLRVPGDEGAQRRVVRDHLIIDGLATKQLILQKSTFDHLSDDDIQPGRSGKGKSFVRCIQRVLQAVVLYCSCRAAKPTRGNFQKTFYKTFFTK